jgi:hypothetical protein
MRETSCRKDATGESSFQGNRRIFRAIDAQLSATQKSKAAVASRPVVTVKDPVGLTA